MIERHSRWYFKCTSTNRGAICRNSKKASVEGAYFRSSLILTIDGHHWLTLSIESLLKFTWWT